MSDSGSRSRLRVPWNLVATMAVAFADAEAAAGAAEIGGNNCGPFCEKYLNANHPEELTHHGEPWCVAFYGWCWLQAERVTGQDLPVAFTRSAGELWTRMCDHGLVLSRAEALAQKEPGGPLLSMRPAPGDAAFWDFNGNGEPDHVNMVHHIEGGVLYTIGGNEGSEASGAPVRVKRRGLVEELPQLLGFGRMYREVQP